MNRLKEISNNKHIKQIGVGGLKGLISGISVIGSIIAGAYDSYQNSRQEDIVQQLSQRIEKLGQDKIDIEYIKSEEFIDLIQKAIKVWLQSRSKQKAKFILGLLTESLRKDRDQHFSTALKESFLSVLDQLTDDEMLFLYDFSKGKFQGKSKDTIYQSGDVEGVAMDTLLAKGILREDSTWNKHIVESMFGREFIAYLKLLAKED